MKANGGWVADPLEAVAGPWPRQNEAIETVAPIAGLRELSINVGYVDRHEVDRLAVAPLLSTLRTLEISGYSLGVEGFRSLASSPHLGKLTALRLPSNYIGNRGINVLFSATSLTALTEIDLSES